MKWNCSVTAEKVCRLKAINPKKVAKNPTDSWFLRGFAA